MDLSEQMKLQSELLSTRDNLLKLLMDGLSSADYNWLSSAISFVDELTRQLHDRSSHSTIGKRRKRSSLRRRENCHLHSLFRKSRSAVTSQGFLYRGVPNLATKVSDNSSSGESVADSVKTVSKQP